MTAFDFGTGSLSVLALVAGVGAAVVLAVVVAAWRRGWLGRLVLALGVLLMLAGIGAILFDLRSRERSDEGRALAQRADELAARALTPDSLLACLDAPVGPMVETGCEGRVFGRPENIAAAVSFTAAKLALLSEGAALAGANAERARPALAALRRDIEADRFGIVAQILAVNSKCSADRCEGFALVANADRIKANLREGAFEDLVARHAQHWPTGEEKPATADATPRLPGGRLPLVAKPLSPGQDFPSAASIPPVSIMTPEPARPPEPASQGNARQATGTPAPGAAADSPPLPRPAPRSSSRPAPATSQRPAPAAPQRPAAATPPDQN